MTQKRKKSVPKAKIYLFPCEYRQCLLIWKIKTSKLYFALITQKLFKVSFHSENTYLCHLCDFFVNLFSCSKTAWRHLAWSMRLAELIQDWRFRKDAACLLWIYKWTLFTVLHTGRDLSYLANTVVDLHRH